MHRFVWTAAVVAVFTGALAGCVSSHGALPLVRKDEGGGGLKMLKPGAHARTCRTWVLGVPVSGTSPSLDELLRGVFARDPEGDVLADVRVTTSAVMTGVVNRMCVEVSADLAREISVVRLPSVGEGHEHHH